MILVIGTLIAFAQPGASLAQDNALMQRAH